MAERELSERERESLEDLALLHGVQNHTFEECARELRVSSRTLKRWAKTSNYRLVLLELQERWRADAETTMLETAKRAVEKMRWLMENAKPGSLVQYYATKALIDAAGLGVRRPNTETDDREELNEIYRLLAQRSPQVSVQLPPGTLIATPGEPTAQALAPRVGAEVLLGEAREV